MTLLLLLSFTFFFVQLAFVFAYGNYAHYATFMSARALLSSRETVDDQKNAASEVAKKMLARRGGGDLLPGVARGQGGTVSGVRGLEFDTDGAGVAGDSSWHKGVRYTFRSRVFVVPMGRRNASRVPNQNGVTLTSESWLGRESSETECAGELNASAHGRTGVGTDVFLVDNGC